ncbi:hypothetical protein Taro_051081 [Colocasia esculenta]|uniref:CCHC-type domain-containing protein n=1 Tax=Colocasia esculenta TaxID=4460 RepID=A0A843XFW2_COLES|nr:hypothetical protein [Colocasia esculenta]
MKILASTSFVAKLISQDIDGQVDCRLLPVSGSRCGRLLVYKQKRLVEARRTFLDRRPVQSRAVAVQGRYLQLCSSSSSSVEYCTSGYAPEISGMADRRDWGGGGDDPEESTQRMIERIWESLTDIRARMDQQAPIPPVAVPPGDGEVVPIAPVPPRVEVTFVAPVPPPVLLAEEPVMQVEKFLRLQPPTYSGGPNPDTAEHWVHEIERVFATMRCPAADKVVLAAYQLRGFALEWWRLKMQTTFAGRTEEAITWSEFLDVFNDTFFPIQVQQVKREQFRTLQQGNSSVLEYQMRFMALSRYAPYVVSDNNMMVEYFIRGLRVELQDAIVPLMCKTVEEAAQRAATLERSIRTRQVGEPGSGSFRLPQQSVGASKGKAPAGPSSSGFGKWGQKLKQVFKGKGRGWGGRQQFQQGRGRPEVEESQQSTARQPITPPGYRCYNCNQPGHLIRNCPYPREYGYGRGVQQQQSQQFQQPQAGRGRGVPQQRGRGRRATSVYPGDHRVSTEIAPACNDDVHYARLVSSLLRKAYVSPGEYTQPMGSIHMSSREHP